MSMREDAMGDVADANRAAADAWGGTLFERLRRVRHRVAAGVDGHSRFAFDAYPPPPGARALDVGCGFGDTTRRLAALVGTGEAVGIDIAPPFIATAVEEAAEIGNLEYRLGDAQVSALGGPYDYVFSRLGLMFFADPHEAFANIRGAMRPGGRLCFVVWRRKEDNPWVGEVEKALDPFLGRPREPDAHGPGPFSMADPGVVTELLVDVGFEEIEFRRCDLPMPMGATLDEAVDLTMSLGAACEALRDAGDRVDAVRPRIVSSIAAALEPFVAGSGVEPPSSTWTISAVAPPDRRAE
jgi:SAM-dependent methyltransferase